MDVYCMKMQNYKKILNLIQEIRNMLFFVCLPPKTNLQKMLQIGTKAPYFEGIDENGNPVEGGIQQLFKKEGGKWMLKKMMT